MGDLPLPCLIIRGYFVKKAYRSVHHTLIKNHVQKLGLKHQGGEVAQMLQRKFRNKQRSSESG